MKKARGKKAARKALPAKRKKKPAAKARRAMKKKRNGWP